MDRSDWGDDETEPVRPPLPPDDRVWRHPSELSGRIAGPPEPAPAPRRRHKKSLVIAVASAGLLLVVATGVSLRFLSDRSPRFASARATTTTGGADPTSFATTLGHTKQAAGLTLLAKLASKERQSQAVVVDGSTLVTTVAAVSGARALSAVMPDGRRVPGELLGMDKDAGIAVVSLSRSAAAPDATGTAVGLHTGDKVWMAGYDEPGTITAMGRHANLPNGSRIHHVMRLDLDTDKVKEGQPILDGTGKVVGLCTRDATGAVVGIPIDLATYAASSFRTNHKLDLPWLGVTGGDKAPDPGDGVPEGGAYITSVTPGGPAHQAGLQPGDIVVAFGNVKIGSISAFVLAARAHSIGEAVTVTVVRDGQAQSLSLTLAKTP